MNLRSQSRPVVALLCPMSLPSSRRGAISAHAARRAPRGVLASVVWPAALSVTLALGGVLAACGGEDSEMSNGRAAEPVVPAAPPSLDVRVQEHGQSRVSEEGLAYVKRLHAATRAADELAVADVQAQLDVLLPAARELAPEGDSLAAVARLELLARIGELMLDAQRGAEVVKLLLPIVGPEQTLPLETVTAQLLVQLGDGAMQSLDTDLAIASYARSVRLMGLLRQKMQVELGLEEGGSDASTAHAKEGQP